MKRMMCAALATLLAGTVLADPGTRPGLWEMKVLKSVVDGKDTAAQMQGMGEQMRAAMASMSPEQRAKMQAMMGDKMGMAPGGGGAVRMCVTPEMAKRDLPVLDKDGACKASNVQHNGNRLSYTLTCKSDDGVTVGTGESVMSGDTVQVRGDYTTKGSSGTHTVHTESELKFVASDCGAVKPPATHAHD